MVQAVAFSIVEYVSPPEVVVNVRFNLAPDRSLLRTGMSYNKALAPIETKPLMNNVIFFF